MTEPERTRSPAYLALRASARRVLRLIEAEIARQGGGVATIYTDQFELCGGRRVYRPALAEIHALGLAEIERHPKRYVCRLSNRWCEVRTKRDALIASAAAREHCNHNVGARPSHAEDVGPPPSPDVLASPAYATLSRSAQAAAGRARSRNPSARNDRGGFPQ
jgi:hypothetical protein